MVSNKLSWNVLATCSCACVKTSSHCDSTSSNAFWTQMALDSSRLQREVPYENKFRISESQWCKMHFPLFPFCTAMRMFDGGMLKKQSKFPIFLRRCRPCLLRYPPPLWLQRWNSSIFKPRIPLKVVGSTTTASFVSFHVLLGICMSCWIFSSETICVSHRDEIGKGCSPRVSI